MRCAACAYYLHARVPTYVRRYVRRVRARGPANRNVSANDTFQHCSVVRVQVYGVHRRDTVQYYNYLATTCKIFPFSHSSSSRCYRHHFFFDRLFFFFFSKLADLVVRLFERVCTRVDTYYNIVVHFNYRYCNVAFSTRTLCIRNAIFDT